MPIPKTLILTGGEVKRLIDMKQALVAVEEAFKQHGLSKVRMPPKIYLNLEKYNGDFRAMPAYIEKMDRCVLKWVNVHPNNKKTGLPTVMALIILSDPKNGFPLCIMDATLVTSLRTGAAGGVAARRLARKDSTMLSLVGCGTQAKAQLTALREIFKFKEIRLWSKDNFLASNFLRAMKTSKEEMIICKNIKECVNDADIIVTTTPSRKPIVKYAWLKKGCHINAVGADAKGKEELEPLILKKAKVVVDSFVQSAHSGEINVPFSKGMIKKDDIYAELGVIIAGKKKGRTSDKEITVFDSTGLAIQDLAVANIIYESALKNKCGKWINLLGL